MMRFLQVGCFASTLVCVLIAGNVLGELSWQSQGYWNLLLHNRPVPAATKFLQEHWRICLFLVLFPWLAFVSLPLVFPSHERRYWDTQSFLLRLCTFVLTESAIVLLVLLSVFAPAADLLKALPAEGVPPLDSCVKWMFWMSVSLIIVCVAVRRLRRRSA